MKYDFLVLGSSGLQGRIVSRDLLESGYKIHCADLYRDGSEDNLSHYPGTTFSFIDLRQYSAFSEFMKTIDAKVVVNCAEGDWNHDVYRVCLEEKKHVIDLGSDIPMTKAQLRMNKAFVTAGLTAITGCGSTPGVNNIMFRHATQFFNSINTVEIGFAWDSDLKKFRVPFSIESVIEELTEPAPYIDDGVWKEKPPLETEVIKEIREIGTQKCFIVRHPETYTFYNEYKKLGLRNVRFYAGFPDHSLRILKMLIDLGLGDKDLLKFENIEIRPVDALSRILSRMERPENYREKENLWVEISGTGKDGSIKIMRLECIVFTLPDWLDAGCNIDTGIPASIIAQMVIDGRVEKRGSFTPDEVIPTQEFFSELKKKGMMVYQDGSLIN